MGDFMVVQYVDVFAVVCGIWIRGLLWYIFSQELSIWQMVKVWNVENMRSSSNCHVLWSRRGYLDEFGQAGGSKLLAQLGGWASG